MAAFQYRPGCLSAGVHRIFYGKGAEIAVTLSLSRHRGSECLPGDLASQLVIAKNEHLVLPDGTSDAHSALIQIERAGPVPLPLGLVVGTFSVNGLAANDALLRFE